MVEFIAISWYNNSVKKRGDNKKQDIKKDLTPYACNEKSKIIQKAIYILIETR